MKCSKCGYKAKDIQHMAAHYRKAHPKAMKKKAAKPAPRKNKLGWDIVTLNHPSMYCPTCGKKA